MELSEKEPGRPIFYVGINGLKPGLATELTMSQLENWWEELPQGSIIAIDECQEDHLMPKDRGNPSAWVQKITKVRHFGMDFLLTTQHPANMSAYVRRLVDLHVHSVMRSKGVRQTFTWMRCIDDPDNRREKKFADVSFSPLPKEVFELYKSSSLHTMKVRTPKAVKILLALVVALIALGGLIAYRMHQHLYPVTSTSAAAASPSKADSSSKDEASILRQKDFNKWMKPRVDGLPWSAPMFDKLEVQAQPRLYCVADENGGCLCETEQGTRYDEPVKTCRAIVANGVYNPFIPPPDPSKATASDGGGHESDGGSVTSRSADPSLALAGRQDSVSESSVMSSLSWKSSPLHASYTPPEQMPKEGPIQSGTGM